MLNKWYILSPFKFLGKLVEINEIAHILEKYNINVKRYSGYDGKERSFKQISGQSPSIIHMATHGFSYSKDESESKSFYELLDMNHDSPLDLTLQRCGLILSEGNEAWNGKLSDDKDEDGILLANEIASLDLSKTSLVVLSSCQSGLGDITSEGVYGLQRAFKQAGVKTLIMSLWKIDDVATMIMMKSFYQELMEGQTKRHAFINAQKRLREFKEFDNPFYWASFIMLD